MNAYLLAALALSAVAAFSFGAFALYHRAFERKVKRPGYVAVPYPKKRRRPGYLTDRRRP